MLNDEPIISIWAAARRIDPIHPASTAMLKALAPRAGIWTEPDDCGIPCMRALDVPLLEAELTKWRNRMRITRA